MRARRLVALPVATLLVGALATPLAVAQDTSPGPVVHRESVLTELSSTGSAGTSRVFTQVTMPSGEVVLPNQSTSGLRGLSGPGPVRDGDDLRFTSDTAAAIRTVADNTADLPVSVEVTYAIDGTQVDPEDVVGHDGEVAVTYTVRNLTAEPTELTLVDGDGNETTETVDVAVPMVGSLALTLPDAFTNVTAPGGVVVGNGRGSTVINWSLLLFAPLGSETQEVTWTAQARDAVVPSASLQVLPVTPDSFGSLASTETAYAGAVDSTTELTEGAREIDANLLKLVDGAAQLLDGLTQLRDGSQALSNGLVDAAAGAGDLSDGIGQARTGAGELSSGLGELAGGAGKLAGGTESARSGATELNTGLGDLATGADALSEGLQAARAGGTDLSTGLGQLSAGAGELADGADDLATGAVTLDAKTGELVAGAGAVTTGATQVLAGIQQLSDELTGPSGLQFAITSVGHLIGGIGSTTTDDTILWGLQRLALGISNPSPSCDFLPDSPNPCGLLQAAEVIIGSTTTATAGLTSATTELQAILGDFTLDSTAETRIGKVITDLGAVQVGVGTAGALAAGMQAGIGSPNVPGETLLYGLRLATAGVSNPACDPKNPTDKANPCGLLEGLQLLQGGLSASLTELKASLGSTDTPKTLLWGAGQVAGGTQQLSAGAAQLKAEGTAPLAAGAGQVSEGAEQLAAGATAAADGGSELTDGLARLEGGGVELSAGATRAAAGSTELASGLGELDAGADALADGASRAADGSVDLNNGLVQLDEGGAQLAEGLVSARKGSRDLFSGLTMATAGGKQVADGSEQLAEEGTSVLAGTVSEATVSSSLQLEQVRAVAARGVAGEGLPYPTAEGAVASAVYQFDLAGVGPTDGPGAGRRLAIGLVALLLALGAGIALRGRVVNFSDAGVTARDHSPA